MKRIFFFTLCLLLSNFALSQEMQEEYVQLAVFSKSSTKYVATVDFGDGIPEAYMGDSNGQKKIFHSAFEPVKSLLKNGWKVDFFQSVTAPGGTFFIWIIKKQVRKDGEVKDDFGPMIKD